MLRTAAGGTDRPEVIHLRLEAFDVELDRGAPGEDQGHGARRRLALIEGDRQQFERLVVAAVKLLPKRKTRLT